MTTIHANFTCKCEDICCPSCGQARHSITMKERDQKVLCLGCNFCFVLSIFFTVPLPLKEETPPHCAEGGK